MTYEELTEKVEKLLNGRSALDVDVSPDFQCDQMGGYPVSLCVLWDQGKAWLEPNEMLSENVAAGGTGGRDDPVMRATQPLLLILAAIALLIAMALAAGIIIQYLPV